jgi:hypothetical protein
VEYVTFSLIRQVEKLILRYSTKNASKNNLSYKIEKGTTLNYLCEKFRKRERKNKDNFCYVTLDGPVLRRDGSVKKSRKNYYGDLLMAIKANEFRYIKWMDGKLTIKIQQRHVRK